MTLNDRAEGKGLPALLLGGFLLIVAVSLVFHFWMAPTIFEQNRQAGEDIAEEEMDRESALREYRFFRQQWYDIQSAKEQLENYEQEEHRFHNQTWPDGEWKDNRDARTRHSRMHDRIVGQENQIENLVAEYNARQSDATRAIFNCGLPWSIDEKLFITDGTGVEYTSQEAASKQPPEDPSECEFSGTVTAGE